MISLHQFKIIILKLLFPKNNFLVYSKAKEKPCKAKGLYYKHSTYIFILKTTKSVEQLVALDPYQIR